MLVVSSDGRFSLCLLLATDIFLGGFDILKRSDALGVFCALFLKHLKGVFHVCGTN